MKQHKAKLLRQHHTAVTDKTMTSADFVNGNTYTRLRDSTAKFDKTGTHRRVHKWTLYVNIPSSNDTNLIRKVKFNMPLMTSLKFISHCPIETRWGGDRWRRFQMTQQTYGPMRVRIAIIGRGGTVMHRHYRVVLSPGGKHGRGTRCHSETFVERRPLKPLGPVPMADTEFGIELELSTSLTSSDISHGDVADLIEAKASVTVKDMTDYALAAADSRTDIWRLAGDTSIACSSSSPNCNTFEIVSPILRGGTGIREINRVMHALGKIPSININKSMGFHVHINVECLNLGNLKNVCQNFVKYEKAMDKFMPQSRHESNYCRSNRSAFGGRKTTNKYIHEMIASCTSKEDLGNLMSPDKYYKLNMQPLVLG